MGGRLAVKGGCSEGEYVVAVGGLRLFAVGGSGSLTKWDAEAVVWGGHRIVWWALGEDSIASGAQSAPASF